MYRRFLVLLLSFSIAASAHAQFSRYLIKLKDKSFNNYNIANPAQFLTQRALDRRTRYNIPVDASDLPVTQRYLDSIRLAGNVTILNVSKWMNQVCIRTTDAAALAKINAFSFVSSVSGIAARQSGNIPGKNKEIDSFSNAAVQGSAKPQNPADWYNYGLAYPQIHMHNAEFLHNRGFRGQGMQMAIMDVGFYHYQSLPTFDSARNNNQVLGTWDFVTNDASVNEDGAHGMECLSTIAANMPGTFVGTAPRSSYYLYRTEDVSSEYPIEEQNLAAALERADSLGVDVGSVSLGYNTFTNSIFDYSYSDMNGNTTMSARAADLAAKKGMTIVVAAGNDGNNSWHYIGTPADADSVLAVGAVGSSRIAAGFSSYGPSSDGQVKPDVAALGSPAVIANSSSGQPGYGSGTSYACPVMAGITTCLWQAFPEVNNMDIIEALRKSSDRYSNPDNRTGYGIPDTKRAFVSLIKKLYTQQGSITNCNAQLQIKVKTDSAITVYVERKLSGSTYTVVSAFTGIGGFQLKQYNFTDDLSSISSSQVSYRFRMKIATDTSFYIDSMTLAFTPRPALGADQSATKCSTIIFDLTALYNTSGLSSSWTLSGNTVAAPAAITSAGIYQLTATNTSGCSDTARITITNDPLLCDNPNIEKTEVRPNPVSDVLTINVIRTAAVKASIMLYNSVGQKVYAYSGQQPAGGQSYLVPVKQFSRGVYVITIQVNDKRVLRKKIVID